MRRIILAVIFCFIADLAHAQSNPSWTYGYVPTPEQWNSEWASKQDYLGSAPCLTGGCILTGELVTAASTTITSGFSITPGVAPTSPINGNMWTTTAGLFVQINGTTIGPLSGATSTSFAATSPILVSFPAGVVTYAFDFTSANTFMARQTTQGATTTAPGWYTQITGDTVPRIRIGTNATDVPSIALGPGNAVRDTFIERAGPASIRFGSPDSNPAIAQTLSMQNVVAGTSNTAGANLTFLGSAGTGTGTGGNIIFQVAPAGSSGSGQNPYSTAITIFGDAGITAGAPTGGDKGVGTINATNIYVAGNAVASIVSSPLVLNASTGALSLQGGTGQVVVGQGGTGSIFTASPQLGNSGVLNGSLVFANVTSGTITIAPPAGALGAVTNTMQAVSDTFVYRATTDTLTNKTLTSPTINGGALSGTFTGNTTLSGNITYSGQLIETGTSPPTTAAGQSVLMGTISLPSLTNNGQAFYYNTAVQGAVMAGKGSVYDSVAGNSSGTAAMGVSTGTVNVVFNGTITAASLSTPGTIGGSLCATSGGLFLYASGVNCFTSGAASSLAPGTTTISPSTPGSCLDNVGGIVGQRSCLTKAQGRVTLQANTPVMTTSAAGTTLRYDCYNGGQVPYYDGTQDRIDTISSCEVTDVLVAAASAGQVVSANVYDVWWVHSGANRICLAMSASTGGGGGWASDAGSNTARGTGYSVLDRTTRAYTTNKNALTNCFNAAINYGSVSANQATYLGTVYASANGTIGWTIGGPASGGTAAVLGVWNMYNRVNIATTVTDTGSNYAYTTASYRQARASAGNQVQYVTGLAEDGFTANYTATGKMLAATSAEEFIGIGFDVTNAPTSTPFSGQNAAALSTLVNGFVASYSTTSVGFHTVAAVEQSDGTNANVFDQNSANALIFNMRM